jgi:hypothetical protein
LWQPREVVCLALLTEYLFGLEGMIGADQVAGRPSSNTRYDKSLILEMCHLMNNSSFSATPESGEEVLLTKGHRKGLIFPEACFEIFREFCKLSGFLGESLESLSYVDKV